MAHTVPPVPVKLFVITLHRDPEPLAGAIALLQEQWGTADFVSEDFAFDFTNYYEAEMGKNLSRRIYSFERLITPDQLVEAKLFCNQIEEKYRGDSGRTINLDPGTIDNFKLVLASAKFGGQKIYLRDGIYADMTLVMNKKQWESFVWGFPDFKSRRYDTVLSKIREIYKRQAAFLNSAESR